MTHVLERPRTTAYAPPVLQPLGTLRSLTRGAGPHGEPVVMQTVAIPPFAPAPDAYRRPTLRPARLPR
ncbi:hypothetical protein Asp14428_14850 [Actinoplanes sp. NBRC 14428]|uniref:Uncharacterized protein n=1 Tax=Pseudosporangium ferrugineum TaxID=439699 RepID=A0A2T0SAM6_9ACTN|nr:hypothetical protein [Pseudosporangium ferrugineum]PRY30477.1 hypothetical protein CLV70_10429 [Pseudosporangium ferrugineum]BCJ50010.1 hypothetical protein Asp14428_14850 [Actinoplanes sp. NBRC 14428]